MIKPVIINCGGRRVQFYMNLDNGVIADEAISWYLQQGSPPEPEVVHLMSRVVQEGDFVVDGGANVGFFSLLLSQYVGSTGKVLAFEPGQNNLTKLARNLEHNKATNVVSIAKALAANEGTVQFHLARDSGINSCWRSEVATILTMDVPATTLDIECEKNPKLVKLDIEGSELEALKGAEILLTRHPQTPYIVTELNEPALSQMGATPDFLRTFMYERGYQMFILSEHGLLPAMVPMGSAVQVSRNNTNVLWSTIDAVRAAWPEVIA